MAPTSRYLGDSWIALIIINTVLRGIDWSVCHVQKCSYWTQTPDTVSGTALCITCGVEPNLLYELIVESCFFFFSFFFSAWNKHGGVPGHC